MTRVVQQEPDISLPSPRCVLVLTPKLCVLFLEWFEYHDGLLNTGSKSEQSNGAITSLVVGAPATLVGIAISPGTILPFLDLSLHFPRHRLAHPKLVARGA